MAARDSSSDSTDAASAHSGTTRASGLQKETPVPLTPVQAQMFKIMTRSLSIPHFLYADEIDCTRLEALRNRLKAHPSESQKLSYLPFVIKAVSIALKDFPLLNSRVEDDSSTEGTPPRLVMREKHNIGVAMDTPQGLLVPNIKDVASLSVLDIAAQLQRLRSLAMISGVRPLWL